MAEGVVSFVLEKLSSLLIQEAVLLQGVRRQVDWLQKELRWMSCFLKDADAKQRKGNELAKNWVKEVREVARRAEDIIDAFMLEIEPRRQQQRTSGGLIGRIKMYAALPSDLGARHKVGSEIEKLKDQMAEIRASRERYGLVEQGETAAAGEASRTADEEARQARRRKSPHLEDDAVVVGLDGHRDTILDRLLDASDKRRRAVSIVGTGGIGKTTLAKKVFNSSKIGTFFRTSAWVSVSQEYKVDELLASIAKQAKCPLDDDDDLKKLLHDYLMKRRYFIVLDDVWRTNVWEQIRDVLPDVNNCSRVLLTTRSTDVARSAEPGIPPHVLPFLDINDSWELFLRKALSGNQDAVDRPSSCPENLEGIGRELVKRCGGLPLALLVLGGLVSRKDPSPFAWKRVAESMNDWASTQEGEDCLKILGLSYDDLPHHYLRSCFLYLGAFPEDSEIRAAEVIRLWIAEGFIPQTQPMEDTAQGYLEELAQRSMIQVIDKDWADGSVRVFRVHDLFRELCIRESREDEFLSIYNTCTDPNSRRYDHYMPYRLALHNLSTDKVKDFRLPSNVRSLLFFGTKVEGEIFNGLKLLRVINFDYGCSFGVGPAMTPKELKGMIHLRYLRLAGCFQLSELPASIGNLCNLQTLDVEQTRIMRLPKELGRIQTLSHLYLPASCECPPGIGNATNLQTLKIGNSGGGLIERGLVKLLNVRDLSVMGLRATQGTVFLDSLRELKRISSLELVAAQSIRTEFITVLSSHDHLRRLDLIGPMSHEQLPRHCEFPPNLAVLRLDVSRLTQDPMETLEKLPNLMSLSLHGEAYLGEEMACRTRGFPSLRHLVFDGLPELKEWRVEHGAMPMLTSLTIDNCLGLRMIPEGLQHVASLQCLNVSEDFRGRLMGEDWYKIQQVRTVRVGGGGPLQPVGRITAAPSM